MENTEVVKEYEVNENGEAVETCDSDEPKKGGLGVLIAIGAGAVVGGVLLGKKIKAKADEKRNEVKAEKEGKSWERKTKRGRILFIPDPPAPEENEESSDTEAKAKRKIGFICRNN